MPARRCEIHCPASVLDERGEPPLGLASVLELEALPKLSLDRTDGALDLAATARTVGAAHDVIDQLRLQHAGEVAVLGVRDERATPVGAHGLGFPVAGHRGAECRGGHRARRRVGERVADEEPRVVVENEQYMQPLVADAHLAEVGLPQGVATGSLEANRLGPHGQ